MSDQWREFDFAVASGRLQQLEQEFFPRLKLKFQRFFCRAVNRPEFFNARFLVQFMNQVKVDYISLEEFGGANMLFFKIDLAPYAREPFFQTLISYLSEVSETSLNGFMCFPSSRYLAEFKTFTMPINVMPFLHHPLFS